MLLLHISVERLGSEADTGLCVTIVLSLSKWSKASKIFAELAVFV